MTWGIRPLCEEDLPGILSIEKRVYPVPWTDAQFCEEITKPYSRALVITDDETDTRVAAYIVFWLMNGECYILNVAVDPEMRGKGFAKLLVRKCLQMGESEEISKVILEVRKGNLPAISLYQKMGFDICQVRKQFYANGEDAYVMMLRREDEVRLED